MAFCKICKAPIKGRANKVFCSTKCKNFYHKNLRSVTKKEAYSIDQILHRNRSILLEILGKTGQKIKVNRLLLEEKKFRFKYLTHFHVNSSGKMIHYLYDLAWAEFSDDEVLVLRK